MLWDIHPELALAHTPDARAYFGEETLRQERRTVFARTWQPVTRLESLQEPGSFVATEVAGEPVVVLRDEGGVLRALSNVCRHRGSTLVEGTGRCSTLKCPYHGWTYRTSGELMGAPEFAGVAQWSREQTRLPSFNVETFGPYVFVRMAAEGPDLSAWLGAIPDEVKGRGYPLEGYRFLTRTSYEVACNWKVYVDNYLEGYHLPSVHPGLFAEVDYNAYRVETHRYHSTQFAPLKGGEGRRYSGGPEPLWYWLFPNFMMSFYPDNFHTTIVVPTGHNRCVTHFDWFTPEGSTVSLEQTMAFSHQVQQEDIAICEKVQRGLESLHYTRGRYSVRRENGVHHFHRLMAEFSPNV